MNNFNPMLNYQRNQLMAQQALIQNQLNQLNDMDMQTQRFNPYPQNNQPQFFVRQIGSIDEAKSYPVDPNKMYFFLDVGNGKIYMKRLNTDNGKSELYTYIVEENIEQKKETDPIQQINLRLANIENIIGGMINDKSVSNDTKSDGNAPKSNVGENEKSESAEISRSNANDSREKRKSIERNGV